MKLQSIVRVAAISLLCSGAALAQNVSVSVDAGADRKPIDDRIYGLNFATTAQLLDLNVTLNRSGGNAETRYNWQLNAGNRGMDWFFESLDEGGATVAAASDAFINSTKTGGAEPMVTIPTIGWTATLGPNRGKLSSFSIAKYGAQQYNDWEWMPDAGNGIRPDGVTRVTGNDPLDANIQVDSLFQKAWVQHNVSTFGLSSAGGVRYYMMDNEPSLWHETHRDVLPTGATMEQIRDKVLDYGTRVKEADPNALVAAPEEWGWLGYKYSGYDQQYAAQHNNWSYFPDRAAHGNEDFIPWFLKAMKQRQDQSGKRLLDILTVHYYPQGDRVAWPNTHYEFSNDVSTTTQLLRNRSTRGLWDPSYTDESWINDTVMAIPRLKAWVAANYPGTKIGITEYSWGADGHISGAMAQADVFGIFGREGLDLATRWTTPATGTPAYNSIKMYRNYDGAKSTFGDTSVRATVPNADNVAAFAARRTRDGALTVMLLNKQLGTTSTVDVSLANFPHNGSAGGYRLSNTNSIGALPAATVSSNLLSVSLPPQTISIFVLPMTAQPMLLWHNNSNGANALWMMNGLQIGSTVDLPLLPNTAYRVVGNADFDKNGSRDLLWRNETSGQTALWKMNGSSFAGVVDLPLVAASDWKIECTGDLNNDGNVDILWRNLTNGSNAVWLMNGTSLGTVVSIAALPNTAYRMAGASDIDGDGKTDIVWRNQTSGANAVWLMNGTAFAGIRDLPFFANPAARLTAVADVNYDGSADMVWRNGSTGADAVWLMNRLSLLTIKDLPAVANDSLEIVGPR
jgi:hypothetical protein